MGIINKYIDGEFKVHAHGGSLVGEIPKGDYFCARFEWRVGVPLDSLDDLDTWGGSLEVVTGDAPNS